MLLTSIIYYVNLIDRFLLVIYKGEPGPGALSGNSFLHGASPLPFLILADFLNNFKPRIGSREAFFFAKVPMCREMSTCTGFTLVDDSPLLDGTSLGFNKPHVKMCLSFM